MAKRFKKYQIDALNAAFEESEHLTKQKKLELVGETGLDVEQITSRFNRERSKRRTKEKMENLEQKNVDLQEELRESKEREAVLLKELQASKERVAELEAENWKLEQQQQGMDECNSHYDPILMFGKGLAKH